MDLKPSCSVPFPELLKEGYEPQKNCIVANVGTKKIVPLMESFLRRRDEPFFFILELPSNRRDETEEDIAAERFHKDVYYIDGLRQADALALLHSEGGLLASDGLSSFGFGGHFSHDEIMSGKYNVVTLYGKDPFSLQELLNAHEIPRTENLVTAWDTFTENACGTAEPYRICGKTVYDLPSLYRERGMYFAERREDF